MPGEVVRAVRGAGALEVGRRGDQDDALDREPPLDEPGVGQRRGVAADGDVEALVQQVDEAVADVQPELDLRIGGEQRRQPRRELELRHRHRGGHPDQADRLGEAAAHDRLGGLGLDRRGAGAVVERAPDLGQREAARAAVDQPRAEPGLELGDPLADRRLRRARDPGGRGEAAALDGEDEGAQVVEIQHPAMSVSMDFAAQS